jgi:glycosyltransferase involved in cell wall biosynthesis
VSDGEAGDLRLAVLVETAPPLPYWSDAVAELVRRGVTVTLVSVHGRGPLHDLAEAAGARAVALGAGGVRGYPRAVVSLARELRRDRIELVQAVGAIPATLAGAATRLAGRGVPLFHRHHVIAEEPRPFVRAAAVLSRHTMAVSEVAARQAEAEGVDPVTICVAPNGVPKPRPVPDDEVAELRRSLGISAGAQTIVSVARLRPVKGIDVLLTAMGSLDPNVHLVIVGDGPGRDALEAAAPPSRVHFVGYRDDVAPWLALADVVAVPSRMESFGLVAAEALAAARPLVATRVGALADMLTGDETVALLVDPDDAEALATALHRVLADPGLAQQLGESGRALFHERYTIAAMVDSWMKCYAEALADDRLPKRRRSTRRARHGSSRMR